METVLSPTAYPSQTFIWDTDFSNSRSYATKQVPGCHMTVSGFLGPTSPGTALISPVSNIVPVYTVEACPPSLSDKFPLNWNKDEVEGWLSWAVQEFSLEDVEPRRFSMNGKALCLLTKDGFQHRAPYAGDILYSLLQKLLAKGSRHNHSLLGRQTVPSASQTLALQRHLCSPRTTVNGFKEPQTTRKAATEDGKKAGFYFPDSNWESSARTVESERGSICKRHKTPCHDPTRPRTPCENREDSRKVPLTLLPLNLKITESKNGTWSTAATNGWSSDDSQDSTGGFVYRLIRACPSTSGDGKGASEGSLQQSHCKRSLHQLDHSKVLSEEGDRRPHGGHAVIQTREGRADERSARLLGADRTSPLRGHDKRSQQRESHSLLPPVESRRSLQEEYKTPPPGDCDKMSPLALHRDRNMTPPTEGHKRSPVWGHRTPPQEGHDRRSSQNGYPTSDTSFGLSQTPGPLHPDPNSGSFPKYKMNNGELSEIHCRRRCYASGESHEQVLKEDRNLSPDGHCRRVEVKPVVNGGTGSYDAFIAGSRLCHPAEGNHCSHSAIAPHDQSVLRTQSETHRSSREQLDSQVHQRDVPNGFHAKHATAFLTPQCVSAGSHKQLIDTIEPFRHLNQYAYHLSPPCGQRAANMNSSTKAFYVQSGQHNGTGHQDKKMMKSSGQNGDCRLLWDFLNQLLSDDKNSSYIRWQNREKRIFRFVDPRSVAKMWGQKKNRGNMTYEKMSRALRYYYRTNILSKEPGQKLTYRFLQDPEDIANTPRFSKVPKRKTNLKLGTADSQPADSHDLPMSAASPSNKNGCEETSDLSSSNEEDMETSDSESMQSDSAANIGVRNNTSVVMEIKQKEMHIKLESAD